MNEVFTKLVKDLVGFPLVAVNPPAPVKHTGKPEKEYPGWQVNHGSPNRKEPRGSKPENTVVVKVAGGRVGIFVSLSCVVSVSVSLPAPVKSPVSERRVGRKLDESLLNHTNMTGTTAIQKREQNKENLSCR